METLKKLYPTTQAQFFLEFTWVHLLLNPFAQITVLSLPTTISEAARISAKHLLPVQRYFLLVLWPLTESQYNMSQHYNDKRSIILFPALCASLISS